MRRAAEGADEVGEVVGVTLAAPARTPSSARQGGDVGDVARRDAAAVDHPHLLAGDRAAKTLEQGLADVADDLFDVVQRRRRDQAHGRPHRVVGDDQPRIERDALEAASSCSATTYGPSPSSSWSAVSPTHRIGLRPCLLGRLQFAADDARLSRRSRCAARTGRPARTGKPFEHARRDFAGIGAAHFGMHVLRAQGNGAALRPGARRRSATETAGTRPLRRRSSAPAPGPAPRPAPAPRPGWCSSSSCRRPAVAAHRRRPRPDLDCPLGPAGASAARSRRRPARDLGRSP